MQEFSSGAGFREVTNFIYEGRNDALQVDTEVLSTLGYKLTERLFTDGSSNKIDVYENPENCNYKYVAVIRNHTTTEYAVCRTFFDYIEFMRRYLTVLEKINELAASVKPWQRAMRRSVPAEEALPQ